MQKAKYKNLINELLGKTINKRPKIELKQGVAWSNEYYLPSMIPYNIFHTPTKNI